MCQVGTAVAVEITVERGVGVLVARGVLVAVGGLGWPGTGLGVGVDLPDAFQGGIGALGESDGAVFGFAPCFAQVI